MTPPARLGRLRHRVLAGGLHVAVATSPRARFLGLAWLDPIAVDWALELPRCRSVHTFWMRFALDLVWLGADGHVLRVDANVPARRLRACRAAASVVEARSGHGARFAAALRDV